MEFIDFNCEDNEIRRHALNLKLGLPVVLVPLSNQISPDNPTVAEVLFNIDEWPVLRSRPEPGT